MKKIEICYNPYNLTTNITVNNQELAQNSAIKDKCENGRRLQDWIDSLPTDLYDEYNTTDFNVIFKGTLLDFEDLKEVLDNANDTGKFNFVYERIAGEEPHDKVKLIDEIFNEIRNSNFEVFQSKDIESAYNNFKNSEFEICVVATMSSGKSTLINSMLGDKLMPAKAEACTAIITKIKDQDGKKYWSANVYDKSERLLEAYNELTYDDMERLNSNPEVSTISITGDIPFVTSEDKSLVLVDTPGPNNARDLEHKITQNKFLEGSSKSLVLYIMEPTFGNNDDNELLKTVAKSMEVDGKKSRDRFIFVINKMDNRRREDGPISDTLERVEEYLNEHGIYTPNLYPAAALPALNIRLLNENQNLDEDTIDETETIVKKLNRNNDLHLESYGKLPYSVKKVITNNLDSEGDIYNINNALIHTGIPSIEAAINQYVSKYATTANIKSIYDVLTANISSARLEESIKETLMEDENKANEITIKLKKIKKNIRDGESARQFKSELMKSTKTVEEEGKNKVKEILTQYQSHLTDNFEKYPDEEWTVDNVISEQDKFQKYANALSEQYIITITNIIDEMTENTKEQLVMNYKQRLASLAEDDDIDFSIDIDPEILLGANINFDTINLDELVRDGEIEDGEEWIENKNKKWYKPWTWLESKGYWRTKYKSVEVINIREAVMEFISPIQKSLVENQNNALLKMSKDVNKLSKLFEKKFDDLDSLLERKVEKLSEYTNIENITQKSIEENKAKLDWLKALQSKLNNVVKI